MAKLEVDVVLMQEIIDYLQQKPYHEVSNLISKIVNATKE